MRVVSRLLKSCASPPVSCPIASIFCAWMSAFWCAFCSVMSIESTKKPTTVPCPSRSGTTVLRAWTGRPWALRRAYS